MSKRNKSNTITVPVTGPRNPTVVPMLKVTKPGRHKNKDKTPKKNDYFSY